MEGVLAFVNTSYTRKKTDPPDPKLLDRLARQSDDLFKSIFTLRNANYAEAGFGSFLVGASMHLSILQELDKYEAGGDTALRSDQKLSEIYASHVESVFPELLSKRIAKIKNGETEDCRRMGRPPETICSYYFVWRDGYNDTGASFKKGKPVEDSEKARNASRKKHVKAMEAEFAAAFGDPMALARAWRDSGI
jgi:hypothetical protein